MMNSAAEWVTRHFVNAECSGVYSTKALNGRSPDYLNMVVRATTELTAEQVIALGKKFESECGRTSESKQKGIVEMDVDLVQYGKIILRPEEFTRSYFLTGYNML